MRNRLTERDLTRIVRRVINESEEDMIRIPRKFSGIKSELGSKASPQDIIDMYNEVVASEGESVPLEKYEDGYFWNEYMDDIMVDVILDELNYGLVGEEEDYDEEDFSSLRNIEEDDDDDGEKFRYGPEHTINTLNSDVKKFIKSKDLDKEESFRRLDQLIQQRIKPVLDKAKETGYWTDEEIDDVIRYLKYAYNYDYSSGKELPPPNYRY